MPISRGEPLRFGVDEFEVEAKLKASPEYRDALVQHARRAARYARAFAPIDNSDYVDSIEVEDGPEGVRLIAHDWKAIYIEYGTGGAGPPGSPPPAEGRPQGGWSPEFAPLRRGVRAAGLELREGAEKPRVPVRSYMRGGRPVRGHIRDAPSR